MIITCEKCNKTFNIQDKLIPDNGRLLQCGSCGHKWFFKITKQNFEQINQINPNTNSNNEIKEENKKETIYEDKIEETIKQCELAGWMVIEWSTDSEGVLIEKIEE